MPRQLMFPPLTFISLPPHEQTRDGLGLTHCHDWQNQSELQQSTDDHYNNNYTVAYSGYYITLLLLYYTLNHHESETQNSRRILSFSHKKTHQMHFPISKSTKNSSQNSHSRPICRESADSEMQCLHLVHTLSRHSSFHHGGGGGS